MRSGNHGWDVRGSYLASARGRSSAVPWQLLPGDSGGLVEQAELEAACCESALSLCA